MSPDGGRYSFVFPPLVAVEIPTDDFWVEESWQRTQWWLPGRFCTLEAYARHLRASFGMIEEGGLDEDTNHRFYSILRQIR